MLLKLWRLSVAGVVGPLPPCCCYGSVHVVQIWWRWQDLGRDCRRRGCERCRKDDVVLDTRVGEGGC